MSDNNPLKLNIQLKYKYFDKKLQKYVNYNYSILNEGEFSHVAIRNQNFYDNIIDKYAESKQDDKTGQQSRDQIKLAINKADQKANIMNLAIPFSNKYIDLDILDKIIINEGKDKSKNEELKFDNFVKHLKSNMFEDNNYEVDIKDSYTDIKDFFIDIIDKFFNVGSTQKKKINKDELLKIIREINETDEIIINKIIEKINTILKDENVQKNIEEIEVIKQFNFGKIGDILEKLAIILDKTNLDLSQKSKFYTKVMKIKKDKEKEEQKQENIFEEFKNKNFMKLFDINNENGRQIKKLFNILDEDYDKVSTFNKDLYSSSSLNSRDIDEYNSKKPKYYNNKEKLESIIYDYAQYIDKDIYNKLKKNKKDLINHITQRVKPFKQIITYYNIFKLLTELYIIKDTIIFNTILRGSPYKKILNIEPMPQPKLYPSFRGIVFIYSVTFEDIPETSLLRFNINIINNDEKLISNEKKEDKDKKQTSESKKEEDEDTYVEKYIPYSSSIYSQKNDLSEYIIYNHRLDVKKIISQFPFLIKNDVLFKKIKPSNVNEIFINNKLFQHINNGKFIDSSKKEVIEHDETIEKYIRKNYINELFFKKNNILFLNKKFYQITEAKINKNITKQRKKKYEKDQKSPVLYVAYKNIDNRLAYSDVGTTLNFYLDVYCYVKNKIDEKITFNKKFESFFNCNNSANNLDILFKDLLQEYYSENTFKNLLKSNKNIDEVPLIDEVPFIDENPEKNQKQKQYTKPNDDLKKVDDEIVLDDKNVRDDQNLVIGGRKNIKKKEKKDKKLIIKKNKKIKKKKIFSKMYYNNKNNNKKFKKYTSKYHKNKRKINLKTKTIKLIKYYLNY
jgi:hypothetical protein